MTSLDGEPIGSSAHAASGHTRFPVSAGSRLTVPGPHYSTRIAAAAAATTALRGRHRQAASNGNDVSALRTTELAPPAAAEDVNERTTALFSVLDC